jgi:hypothetical protein
MIRIDLTVIVSLGLLSASATGQEAVPPQRIGNLLVCPSGYRLDSGVCLRIYVPNNAQAVGDKWYCKSGYRRIGDKCEPIFVPDNAQAVGDKWYCKSGFRRIGDTCQPFAVPPNAHALGERWVCDIGFKQSGEGCIKVSWEELRVLAEQFVRKAVRAVNACEKLCDEYSSDTAICYKLCEGE